MNGKILVSLYPIALLPSIFQHLGVTPTARASKQPWGLLSNALSNNFFALP